MNNFIQQGKTLTIPAPSTVTSGQLVVVGFIVGVAAYDAASGEDLEVDTRGVFELPKVSSDVVTVGAKLYWNGSALTVTQGTGSKPLVGYAVVAAGNPSSTVKVNLLPTMQTGAA